MPEQQEALLKSLGIVRLEKDVRSMNRDELAEHFSSARSGRIVLAPLIRSVIWQAYERIQEGTEDLGGGNIRSFWYRWLQPTLAHFSDDDNRNA